MRYYFVYGVLLFLRAVSRLLYRQETEWVGDVPDDRWQPYRLVAILNHTSLFEALLAGQVSRRFLWRMARHSTVPVADITINRPIIGWFWRFVAGNVVPISRERDRTWEEVLKAVDDPEAKIIILPEGRMKRANGLDKNGRPMAVRGGIADLLLGIPDGNLLLAYSQGLHHIQIPGQRKVRFFQPVRLRFESLDIATYRDAMWQGIEAGDSIAFRRRVMADLTSRRDRYCTSDVGGTDEPEVWERLGPSRRARD